MNILALDCGKKKKRNQKRDKNPNWKGHTKKRICQQCKKTFEIIETPSLIKRKEGKYCSRKCKGEAQKGRGKVQLITEFKAKKLFEQFKKSKQGIAKFSKMKNYHEKGLVKIFKKYFPDDYEFIQEQKRARKDLWYKKGRRFEYRIRDYLKQKGFWVLRSPRSASCVDLVAIRKNRILMIQCKSGASTIRKGEKEELLKTCDLTGALPILAYRPTPNKIGFRQCFEKGYLDIDI